MKWIALSFGTLVLILVTGCKSPLTSFTESAVEEPSPAQSSLAKNGNSNAHGKATGGITFEGDVGEGRATFQAHDLGPDPRGDRGRITVRGPQGSRTVKIDCVKIDGNTAIFGGETVKVTSPGPGPGTRFVFQVVDNGTPGRNGDTYIASRETGPNNCPAGVARSPHDVLKGNLVVH